MVDESDMEDDDEDDLPEINVDEMLDDMAGLAIDSDDEGGAVDDADE